MKARPILMSGPMVKALLEERKWNTRRIINPQPVSPGEGAYFDAYDGGPQWNWWTSDNRQYLTQIINCPYGKPGDLLWVREGFAYYGMKADQVFYRATDSGNLNWRPSIHLPRWASRLTLELTDVRVERLQDISEEDAVAEGCEAGWLGGSLPETSIGNGYTISSPGTFASAAGQYQILWNSIHGPDAWDDDPWVWKLVFKTHHCNVDEFIKQNTA